MTSVRKHDRLLYGAAYYSEYIPRAAGSDRVERDMAMMREAGFTTIRIAEFTWGTWEPRPGTFDFSLIDRSIDAAGAEGINVIVGTPTAAVPTWLAAAHPEVLGVTASGTLNYGPRQNMDITAPAYRVAAERAIRALVGHTAPRDNVIGFQLDNETKYHDAANPTIQRAFVEHLRDEFHDDLAALNEAFGLDYWANRVNAWEDFPDLTGTINGSLAGAFDRFRRQLVTDFLGWQRGIVDEYRRDDQFVTHNFDYEWRGHSFGVQPAVDHFHAADAVTLAGVDIYHETAERLSGKEIGFGGDINRSLKDGAGYLVLETQAQGQMGWLPYPGQLRLQAYSHFASGAMGLMYWHWGSIHSSFETYWKGLLSQDFTPNPTYREACRVGAELEQHRAPLVGLTKSNKVAVMVSNEALTALEWFSIETGFPRQVSGGGLNYNDVFRWIYDALFDLNIETDIVPASASAERLRNYNMVVVPALYVMPESTVSVLRSFVAEGGHLVTTFRTGVADEHTRVHVDRQPHGLTDLLGLGTDQFTRPDGVTLAPKGALAERLSGDADLAPRAYMELLTTNESMSGATTLEVLARYDHHAWSGPAIARRTVGDGSITHISTWTSAEVLRAVLELVGEAAHAVDWPTQLAGDVTVRRGINGRGNPLTYVLNYSKDEKTVRLPIAGIDVLGTCDVSGAPVRAEQPLTIPGWGVLIVETDR